MFASLSQNMMYKNNKQEKYWFMYKFEVYCLRLGYDKQDDHYGRDKTTEINITKCCTL